MERKLYVGNIPYNATRDEIADLFGQNGLRVERVELKIDRETGQPRGFGFVTYCSEADARRALDELQGATLHGRWLTVNEARPRTSRF
jgi:RNA recognition motif-containing protein